MDGDPFHPVSAQRGILSDAAGEDACRLAVAGGSTGTGFPGRRSSLLGRTRRGTDPFSSSEPNLPGDSNRPEHTDSYPASFTDAYTLTKALAERLAEELWLGGGHRLSVIRPSIIESALRHPHPGWIDVAEHLIAQKYADRIVGLTQGRVVADIPAATFDTATARRLYGSDELQDMIE